jgi:hypothetical protein
MEPLAGHTAAQEGRWLNCRSPIFCRFNAEKCTSGDGSAGIWGQCYNFRKTFRRKIIADFSLKRRGFVQRRLIIHNIVFFKKNVFFSQKIAKW